MGAADPYFAAGDIRVRVRDVQAATARVLGLPLAAMTSPRRALGWALGRQLAMAVAADMTGRSSPFIGRCFRRDHTTVLHALNIVRARLDTSPDLAATMNDIRAEARVQAFAWLTQMRSLLPENSRIPMTHRDDRPCATCAHAIVFGAVTCALFRNTETGRARLATAVRLPGGGCGPQGSFYAPCPKVPATVLPFPIAHRRSA